MEQKIVELILELNEEVVEDMDKDLLASGILDSFDIVNLVVKLEEEFDTEIDVEDVVPDNFRSVNAIVSLVKNITKA